jgi:putative lipoprotein
VWEEARLRGVDFRAAGNEPGWYLEMEYGGQLLLVTDYGERRLTAATPPPAIIGSGASAYHARSSAHDLVVTIQDAPCADDMSGEPFPARVLVQLDDRELRGCGRRLR